MQQLAFIDDVVAIEHGARLVTRQQHGDAFWDASAYQVSRRGSPTIMEQSMGYVRFTACVTEGMPPHAYGDPIATKDVAVAFSPPARSPL